MVRELFKILDTNESGRVACEEFIGGLLRLRVIPVTRLVMVVVDRHCWCLRDRLRQGISSL